jgi:hypothetical protein
MNSNMNRIKLVTIAAFVAISAGIYAQTPFFATKAGTVLIYEKKDGKGQIEDYSRQTINKVESSGRNMTISYLFESMDKDKKVLVEIPCKMLIKNDVMIFDLKHVLGGRLKDPKVKIESATGTPMELPNNLKIGQSLKDAKIIISVSKGILSMKLDVSMTDGKCVAIENVTVPAGTFQCHKITQNVTTVSMGKTTRTQVVAWYAPNIGVMKSETYTDKNQLQSRRELIAIK